MGKGMKGLRAERKDETGSQDRYETAFNKRHSFHKVDSITLALIMIPLFPHGNNGTDIKPVVSGKPNRRFMF